MDSQTKSLPKVTRYRVTIDFTVNNRGNAPSNWNWNKLLELNDSESERVKEFKTNKKRISQPKTQKAEGGKVDDCLLVLRVCVVFCFCFAVARSRKHKR